MVAFAGLVESSIRKFAERSPPGVAMIPCPREITQGPDSEDPTFRTTWFLGLEAIGAAEIFRKHA
jgi:hypothetical protein